ncbi:hypothetical protein MKX40_16705 [Paenibacillus sp. FSL R5-0517]|uniref:hypothetical protein n=1 Tax=Paenibacillus sp. FSL R5-0517 TaxID=2921647 RepID=UPI0030D8B50A
MLGENVTTSPFILKLSDEVIKYDAKSAEWKQKLEAVVHGESFAVIETYPNNLVIYSNKGAAEMLYGEWGLKSLMSIIKQLFVHSDGENGAYGPPRYDDSGRAKVVVEL